ncbi:hypothetical protein Tcur_2608 [Thermomonospora curvata DSM 43183]|uniref:Uncharacterized protein n=1 Tax=Thermomonospora curvata (strain ATCC 19995 / DSM 43183 / JCM 3096 / KCTC 9072 / NBRC 15933 / NCIMB 10081 / Henssen B9) TaxID=471852 RepID=D1A4Z4_THECD|nr:hypothetical protein Tcur_2608 [Thermomonospora curvata DSM 43183]
MVPGHGEADHGFGGGGQGFVVAGRSAMVHEMAEGSLDHPASGRHGETFGGEIAGDGLGVDAQGGGVLDEAREMAATGPGLRAVGCSVRTWPNRRVPAMGVLHARGGDGEAGSRPRASVAMPRLRPSAERETAQQAVRLGGLPSSRQAAKYQYTVLAGRRRHPPARLVQKHSVFTKARVDGGHRLRPRLRRRFKHRLGSSPAPTAGGFTALTRQQIAAGPRPPPRSRFQPAAASRASATRAQTECRALPTESATFHFMTGGLPTESAPPQHLTPQVQRCLLRPFGALHH